MSFSGFIKDQSVIRDWLPNMAAVPHAQQHATLLLPHGTQFNSPHETQTRKATSVNTLAILRRVKAISPVQKKRPLRLHKKERVLWSCERRSRIYYRNLPGESGALRFLRARAHIFPYCIINAQYIIKQCTQRIQSCSLFT